MSTQRRSLADVLFRSSLSNPEPWLLKALGVLRSASGVNVSPEDAMRSTAVMACVKVIAETIGSLDFNLYKRLGATGRTLADSHPLFSLLAYAPNDEMDSQSFREMMTAHMALRGNAYAEIERNGAGYPVALWPLDPRRVSIERANDNSYGRVKGDIYYIIDGIGQGLPAANVLHLHTISGNGLVGLSPVQLNREAIGLALATEEFGARLFSNDARPGGFLTHPGKMSETAHHRLRADWEANHSGLQNAHRVAILEEGLSWQQVGIAPEDAQFLQTRKFQLAEVARIWRVPLHMIGELDRATFSNIEQQSLEFVLYTLMPWLQRWNNGIRRALMTPADRKSYFTDFNYNKLLRGDLVALMTSLNMARNTGAINADEIRAELGLNPIGGDVGELYILPVNYQNAKTTANPPTPPAPIIMPPPAAPEEPPEDDEPNGEDHNPEGDGPANEPGLGGANADAGDGDQRRLARRDERRTRSVRARLRLRSTYRPLFEQAATRILNRERADIMREAERTFRMSKRDVSGWDAWLSGWYDNHKAFISDQMRPVMASYAEAVNAEAADEVSAPTGMDGGLGNFVDSYLGVYVLRHVGLSLGSLRKATSEAPSDPAEQLSAIEGQFSRWDDGRAERIAGEESVRENEAVARETWRDAGVSEITWVAGPKACDYCADLDGETVGIDKNFVDSGDSVRPDEDADGNAPEPMSPESDIGHPPLHDTCECTTAAG